MIQPGQKLNDGDYCNDLTKHQFDELLNIEGDVCLLIYEDVGLTAFRPDNDCNIILVTSDYPLANNKTEYNFADFKQLCENTFQ